MAEESLERLIKEALSLPPEQRPSFLAERLGDDLQSRALALTRLRELEEVTLPAEGLAGLPEPTILTPFDELAPLPTRRLADRDASAAERKSQKSTTLSEAPTSAGSKIGRYTLASQLGRGGMGTVWLAKRSDGQFQRTVALKLISAGQESEAIQSRFLRERQILASLSHPNIAKLLDGGVAPDGRPYFVMDYVDGVPITSYCDERRLKVVDRLRLFLQVCKAVQHAHQRLVVHRDLKPSNILVTNERMVQLLDFGIAKLLHPDLLGMSELTRPEDQAMTPRYAAPEQIRNETITTATDIYALGVLLYELLTGHMPYVVHSAGGHALEQAILECEPRRPSLSLTDPSDVGGGALAALRGTDLGDLRHTISGDLETVVLKALKKLPAERYASAEALAKDLEHYLDGKPISAQPDTLRYRMGKFINRHRAGVALVSLTFVGLLLALAISILQTQRARDTAARAAAVDAFLVGLFEDIDPEVGDANALRARDLLDAGAARVDTELAADPALQGTLNALLGRLLLATGDPQRALARMEQARRSTRLDAPAQQRLARDYANALMLSQRFDEATAVLQEQEQLLAQQPSALAAVLQLRADLDAEAGRLEQANQRAQRALQLWQELPDDHRAERAETLAVLAKIEDLRDHLDEAEAYARSALKLLRERYGGRHLSVAKMLERLANLERRRGHPEMARATLGEALILAEQLIGADHLSTLSMRRLDADLLEELGQLDQSEAVLQSVIDDAQRRYGRYHLSRATALNSLAAIAFRRRDLESAETSMREVVEIYRGVYGPTHNEIATVLNNLANVVRERGRLDEAAELMAEVLAIRENAVGVEHMDYAYSLLGVARIAQLRGQAIASAAAFQDAATIFARVQGENAGLVRSTRCRRIHALIDSGEVALANAELDRLAAPPTDLAEDIELTESWARARLLLAAGKLAEAARLYEGLIPRAQQRWTDVDTRRLGILLDAADAQQTLGNQVVADELFAAVQESAPQVLEPRLRAALDAWARRARG